MTTLASTSAPPIRSVTTTTVFARAVAAEWTRLWTIRSTWWSLLAAVGMMLFVGIGFGLEIEGRMPIWVAGEVAISFVQFALIIPAMLAVTGEHATGAIRTSLQAVPRRGTLAAARATVTVGVAAAATALVTLAADVASWIALGADAEVVAGDLIGSIAAATLVVASGATLAIGVGALLRSSAGTLTTAFLLLLVLPMMLPNFGVAWLATAGEHMPGSAAISLLDAFGDRTHDTATAIVILVAWAAAAGVVGTWSLLRRDAT